MKKLILLLLAVFPVLAQTELGGVAEVGGTTRLQTAAVPTPDFWHSFNTDGGTGATATADQGANCDLTNTTWVSDDAGGNALDFNGTDSIAVCGSDLDAVVAGAVAACVQADTYGGSSGFGQIIRKHIGPTTSGDSWALHMNDFSGTGDRFEFRILNDAAAAERFLPPVDTMDPCVGTATWCHLAVIFSGCTAMGCSGTIYFNGTAMSTTHVDITGTRPSDTNGNVTLGLYSGTGWAFDGRIDEVKVWITEVPDAAGMAADAAACTGRNP